MSEAAAVMVLDEEKVLAAKSAVQKRFDCLTREKYMAKREAAAAAAAVAEERAKNVQLRSQMAELETENSALKNLLEQYRGELEKYRGEIIRRSVKEKHGRK